MVAPTVWAQTANSQARPGILGYLDPHTGAFRPVPAAAEESVDAPATTTFTGTVTLTITITLTYAVFGTTGTTGLPQRTSTLSPVDTRKVPANGATTALTAAVTL
jgi:hypothetical protein